MKNLLKYLNLLASITSLSAKQPSEEIFDQSTIKKTFKILFYVFLFSCTSFLIPLNSLLAEGLVTGTVVTTPTGKVPIEQLKVGDLVVSYNFDTAKLETARIANIFKKKTYSITQLSIGSDTIEVDDDHKFYCPLLKEQWIEAYHLQERHFLLKGLTEVVRITTVTPLQKEAEVYYLTLADNHNFFVSEQEILVHNFAIPLIGAAIAWLVENFVFTVGVSILGIGAGVVLSQADNKDQQKSQYDVYLQYENSSFSPGPEDPKDPKDEEGHDKKGSMYKDVTGRNSRMPNTQTDLTRKQFEENLQRDGWNKTVHDKGVYNYTKDGAKYSLRDFSKSTDGPTADYYKPGSDTVSSKIRLLKG